MAVIPQYSAGGPAQSSAPALEQGGAVRVDARGALSSLGGLMDAVAGAAVDNPTVGAQWGQGRSQSIKALGDGVSRLGAVFQELDREEAAARNDKAVFDAQQDMRRVYGDFEAWKENEGAGESHRWGQEWADRLGQWKTGYFEGREIAPVAREAIDMGFTRFETETAINTKVASAQDAFRQARGSAEQAWSMAVDAGDLELANSITEEKAGRYFHADEVARMNYEAAEKIREKQLDAALMRSDTFAMRGQSAEGRAELAGAPFRTPEERDYRLAEFDTKTAVAATEIEIDNRLANGEDPDAIRAELEARDENGNFKAYPDLPPFVRAKVLAPIYAASNDEFTAMVKGADKAIETGLISDENGLNEYFQGKEIDGLTRAELVKKLRGEVVKTEEAVITAQLDAAKYDPATDPDGRVYTATMNRVQLILGEDPRSESILSTLEKRRRGESLTIGEEMKARKLSEVKSFVEAKGDWRIPSDRIRAIEKGGEKLYIDTGAEVKPGDPGYFEDDGGIFGRTVKGRVLQLSQDDRIAIDQGKAVTVDDLGAKNRALSDGARIADSIQQDMDSGKIQDGAAADEKFNGLVAPMRKDGASAIIDHGLFPASQTPAGAITDPAELRSWLDSYQVTF